MSLRDATNSLFYLDFHLFARCIFTDDLQLGFRLSLSLSLSLSLGLALSLSLSLLLVALIFVGVCVGYIDVVHRGIPNLALIGGSVPLIRLPCIKGIAVHVK